MAEEEVQGEAAPASDPGAVSAYYVHPTLGAEAQVIRKLAGISDDPVESNALEWEDEFRGAYGANTPPGVAQGVQIIQPPVAPKTLASLVHQNNTLQQCIDAMVRNVHGTGYNIELLAPQAGQKQADDPLVKKTAGWLQEVWPLTSFLQLRKQMGEDKEAVGNAYWEVLRNRVGELLMLRRLEPKIMRMVTLSPATPQPVTVRRGEQTIKLQVLMRYRRFVQSIGVKFVFYKEYGCPLLINKNTGELLENNAANRIKLFRERAMGTEILHFRGMEDVDTPYGVPKWYPQMPSVLGSRRAEEFNLEYFQAGGVPPLMIFVQGGTLGKDMRTALVEFLSSKPGAKQGAPVFEVQSTGGTLDNPGAGAKVTVERFGREQQKDSMFEGFDEKCEGRIRRAWRLPPIFVGKSDDYTLATAQASYAVAEAQVFKPARDEFDDLMNRTVMREIEPEGKTAMRSIGLPVKDVNQQLLAANAAFAGGGLAIDHYIETLNEVAGMDMVVREGAVEEHSALQKQKVEMGGALIETAKRGPVQAGSPPGGVRAPKATGRGSASAPSSSSPKPRVNAAKSDEEEPDGEILANLFLAAVRKNHLASIADVLDSLRGLTADQALLFKSHLDNGPLVEAVNVAMAEFSRRDKIERDRIAAELADAA